MSEVLLTSETTNIKFAEDSSETNLIYPVVQTISDITSVGTESDSAIQAFQIGIFIEGTPIPSYSDLKLKRNVIVVVFYTQDGVLIRAGYMDEEGYGVTYEEASIDLLTSLKDRYNSLSRRTIRLSEHELQILERLRMLFD